MKLKEFKKTLSFIDEDNHKAVIKLKLTHRNGYDEFTASGRYCGGGGQCLDSIKPRTDEQALLIKFWNKYHLKEINQGNLMALNQTIENIELEEKKREEEKEEKKGDDKVLEQMEEYGIDESELGACKAYLSNFCDDTELEDFEESYSGQWHNDEEFAREEAESCGLINNDLGWPNNCIDWEQASSDLMQDYFEVDGYYFRSM